MFRFELRIKNVECRMIDEIPQEFLELVFDRGIKELIFFDSPKENQKYN